MSDLRLFIQEIEDAAKVSPRGGTVTISRSRAIAAAKFIKARQNASAKGGKAAAGRSGRKPVLTDPIAIANRARVKKCRDRKKAAARGSV